MTRAEFQALADAYGSDLSRWPAAERRAAASYAASAGGAAILADADRIDRALNRAMPDISPDRIDRAMQNVMRRIEAPAPVVIRHPQTAINHAGFLGAAARWLLPTAGFASAAAFGLIVGIMAPATLMARPPDAAHVISMIFDNISAETDWVIR